MRSFAQNTMPAGGFWDCKGLRDYTPVKSHLPLLEETVTPLGRSAVTFDVTIASFDDVSVVRVSHSISSVGTSVLDPAYLALLIVTPESDAECLVNGQTVRPPAIFMPGAQGGYYIRGAGRTSLAIVLRRDKFAQTVAALQGIASESVSLAGSKLELPPAIVAHVRNGMNDLIVHCGADGVIHDRLGRRINIAHEAISLAAEAYLASDANADITEPRSSRSPEKIVRLAEEYFLAAGGEPVSLADLCKAAGVGKSKLYAAFAEICCEPPLSYFHKRQLMQARAILLNSDPNWGAVKRAAMSSGLTELGRFSVEYRELFGESPSATLRDAKCSQS